MRVEDYSRRNPVRGCKRRLVYSHLDKTGNSIDFSVCVEGSMARTKNTARKGRVESQGKSALYTKQFGLAHSGIGRGKSGKKKAATAKGRGRGLKVCLPIFQRKVGSKELKPEVDMGAPEASTVHQIAAAAAAQAMDQGQEVTPVILEPTPADMPGTSGTEPLPSPTLSQVSALLNHLPL